MGALSPWHIILVALVALLIFGPNKLPELGRGVGKMFREFKDVTTGNDHKEPNERNEIDPLTLGKSAAEYVCKGENSL